jgi:hypothetical protein
MSDEIFYKLKAAAIILGILLLWYKLSEARNHLKQADAHIIELEEREAAFSSEMDRLSVKLRDCAAFRDRAEDSESDLAMCRADLNMYRRDLDTAINFGVKCLDKSLSLTNKLRECKEKNGNQAR